jgi:phosphosulfolactate synthase (CoM biosynthesis protein A)
MNGFEIYVKSSDCNLSLKEIQKHLKNDSSSIPFVKFALGDFKFLQKDLIRLLVFHK